LSGCPSVSALYPSLYTVVSSVKCLFTWLASPADQPLYTQGHSLCFLLSVRIRRQQVYLLPPPAHKSSISALHSYQLVIMLGFLNFSHTSECIPFHCGFHLHFSRNQYVKLTTHISTFVKSSCRLFLFI
jgi:hypothetical protein